MVYIYTVHKKKNNNRTIKVTMEPKMSNTISVCRWAPVIDWIKNEAITTSALLK